MSTNIQKLIKNSKDPKLIEEVFEFAKESYGSRKRSSGENYIEHAVNVALILSEMGLDQKTITAGLLHDVADTDNLVDKKNIIENIGKKFGKNVAEIVEKNSQLNKIYYSTRVSFQEEKSLSKENTENLRKMFFAISQDLRVVLIDLASRIDGLGKIDKLPIKMQKAYAAETLEIFVPIANRLGLGEVKTKLEDMAFAYLYPDKFKWLESNIKEKYEERQRYLKKFIPHLKKILKHEKIKFWDINYRAKSYWSTYQKLLTHNMDFEKIHDLVALRVIVNNVEDCYKTLGIIHKYYKPISEEINDYIARPKSNGYKSLHTTVFLEKDKTGAPIFKIGARPNAKIENLGALVSEIQIRTDQMQKDAEYGVCAHWSYKERIDLQKEDEKFSWINPIRKDLGKNMQKYSPEISSKTGLSNGASQIPEFWKTFKIDFFSDQIFAFTPKGDVIVLPKGSIPIDFAYAVHSDIGNHCESAKIDGKIITLNQPLKNGDVVEIITNKKRAPSQDWLRFVKTNFAKSHIKKIFIDIPASILSVPSFVKKKIIEFSEKAKKNKGEKIQLRKESPSQIYLAGQKGIMVTVAKCCAPKIGDQAKAYLTKYRAAVLHKTSCKNLQKISQKFPEKIIAASWK